MRKKSQYLNDAQRMQSLLEKQFQLEADLKKCEDSIDLFQTYYLQNSFRTGNIFLGWPICSYSQITEFINKPKIKRNMKPYIEIQEHQKLFSISSITSKAFSKISKINYLATKQLYHSSRPKIFRTGKKRKENSTTKNTIKEEQDIFVDNYNFENIKQEDEQYSNYQQEQSEQDQIQNYSDYEQPEIEESSQYVENEIIQNEKEDITILNNQEINCKKESNQIKLECHENQQPLRRSKRVSFILENQCKQFNIQNQNP